MMKNPGIIRAISARQDCVSDLLHEDHQIPPLSRRGFLEVAASVAGGSMLAPILYAQDRPKLGLPPGRKPSRVVITKQKMVIDGPKVHKILAREMLEEILIQLTQRVNIKEAWRSILKHDDTVGLKFNQSSQQIIGTTDTLAEIIITSILDAGYRPEQIVCIEAPAGLEDKFSTQPAWSGFDLMPTDFGSGADQMASILGQVTALINIPYLKTHNIAGFTCTLKNLSHAFIKHPARYHHNGCSPFIADIVNLPQIRTKLKLCLVDCLRVVFDKGPEASTTTMEGVGAMLASFDPVAIDMVGLSLINEIRKKKNLNPIAQSAEDIGYLAEAHRLGIGVAVPHGIDLIRLNR